MTAGVLAMRVGILGLGAMGSAMAARLLSAGHEVRAYDPDEAAMAGLVRLGAERAATPFQAATDCEVLLVIVRDATQAEAALFGPDGAAAGIPGGATVWLASTVPPAFAEETANRLLASATHLLDGPVSGGAAGAAAGELAAIIAGDEAAMAAVRPLLPVIARHIFEVSGRAGDASRAKMVNQLLTATHIVATAEALTLGMTSGLDPALLYRIICASSGTSRMFETKAPIMLSGDATSGPRLAIFEKDLQIILAEAASLACAIPLARAVSRVVASALASEGGGITDSSVIQAYRRQNGQEFGEWP
ncbi:MULTISPECIES: NAD(P)-dependent oxidoreductase [unclassified Acidisoma]|uniref:NAD(P)-dependent oxidoreductase n=1 Tax=unclassified Acidisoma TaxID=2634065 RepID=UPI00131CCD13|nr:MULTISPECIES: NAD(P)-dependent oxidoreductase [unclassified Acidisoma]